MNEIKIMEPDVTLVPAVVTFPGYEKALAMANKVADYINSVELSDDNVKEVKKDLADARKVTKALSDRRIALKKEILMPYNAIEKQINEICSVIDKADRELRDKVNELEEEQRDQKRQACRELWGKRYEMYQLAQYAPAGTAFEIAWSPTWANKSTSFKIIEAEMVEWLEDTENCITTLKSLDDDYLVEYICCMDINMAIANVKARREREDIVGKALENDAQVNTPVKAMFIVYGSKDIKLTEMLLNENEIKYERK